MNEVGLGRFGAWSLVAAGSHHIPFLRRMLLEAIFVPEGEPRPTEAELDHPEVARYLEGFGERDGDLGVVALDGDRPVGACWSRVFPPDRPGFGWVGEGIPELSVAVAEECRERGLGTRLVETVMRLSEENQVELISLSVDSRSRAVALYERLGFEHVGWERDSLTMVAPTSGG